MEKSFTQRMSWLHTWFGLVLGWLAFALFLTGTLSVFWLEIQHWAQPELHGAKMLSIPQTVDYSLDYLRKVAPDSKRWNVYMPDFDRHPLLVLSWLDENDAQQFKRLVPDGSGREVTTVTNGGRFFVDFHWTFNNVVPDLQGRTFKWTYMLSGLVGMGFLIGTITGLVIHKKIFRNFFTFRRNAKVPQTRWLDAHNVLGVFAWPFHFVIVLSGLVFYCYLYIPTGMQMAARYPAPRVAPAPGVAGPGMLWGRIAADAVGDYPANVVEPGNPAANVAIPALFAQATELMGPLSGFAVSNPGRDNAVVRMSGPRARPNVMTFSSESMTFDGVTGTVLSPPGNRTPAVQKVTNAFAGIHFAFFGGTPMRILYFLSAAAGTIMIATGLIMFTTKRKAMAHSVGEGRFYAFVERMNVASIGGALIACASYLWAIRLLPQSLSDPSGGYFDGVYASIRAIPFDQAVRSDWELYLFWGAWGVAAVHAFVRVPHRAWTEQFAAGAVLCIGMPAIGYLVPNCDLGSMIRAGDWKMVAVDLSGLSIGLMLAYTAWKVSGKRVGVPVGKLVAPPVLSPAE
ncbi:MAG: PepSY-associated TM helix domain-containing protein [Vicinamibacterales bacterium]